MKQKLIVFYFFLIINISSVYSASILKEKRKESTSKEVQFNKKKRNNNYSEEVESSNKNPQKFEVINSSNKDLTIESFKKEHVKFISKGERQIFSLPFEGYIKSDSKILGTISDNSITRKKQYEIVNQTIVAFETKNGIKLYIIKCMPPGGLTIYKTIR